MKILTKTGSIFILLLFTVLYIACEKRESYTVEDIVHAYEMAVTDGQYQTHLDKFIYPDVADIKDKNAFLKNRDKVEKTNSKKEISHELREVTTREMESLEGYFKFPVKPTHVIDFKVAEVRNRGEKIATTKPLFVKRTEKSWYVVPAIMKKAEEIVMNYQEESLEFYQDDGLWRHHWELQFDVDSDFDYQIILESPVDNGKDKIILEKKDVKFYDDSKIIRFHLMPKGKDSVFERDYDENIMIPYAYQAGSRSVSSSVTIPGDDEVVYKPNKSPQFSGNELEIARIKTTGDSEERYYMIKLIRTTRNTD